MLSKFDNFDLLRITLWFTARFDKISEKLPERVESFIGWASEWKVENYENKIKELYSKRCKFVHNGNRNNITKQDLDFSDSLLLNVFYNIVKHKEIFKSKQGVVDFSEKVRCERILEVEPKVRPETLKFIKKSKKALKI